MLGSPPGLPVPRGKFKWGHTRRVVSDALYEAYDALFRDGRAVTREEIESDAERLFAGNFSRWVGLTAQEHVRA